MSLHQGDGSPAATDGYSTESTIVGRVTTPPAYALDGSSSTLPSTYEDRTQTSELPSYPQEATIINTSVPEETQTTVHNDNASHDVTHPHPSSQDAAPTGTASQINSDMQMALNSPGLQEATPQSGDTNADITAPQKVTSNDTLSLEMQTVPSRSSSQEATLQSREVNVDIMTSQEVTSNETLSPITSHDLAISTDVSTPLTTQLPRRNDDMPITEIAITTVDKGTPQTDQDLLPSTDLANSVQSSQVITLEQVGGSPDVTHMRMTRSIVLGQAEQTKAQLCSLGLSDTIYSSNPESFYPVITADEDDVDYISFKDIMVRMWSIPLDNLSTTDIEMEQAYLR